MFGDAQSGTLSCRDWSTCEVVLGWKAHTVPTAARFESTFCQVTTSGDYLPLLHQCGRVWMYSDLVRERGWYLTNCTQWSLPQHSWRNLLLVFLLDPAFTSLINHTRHSASVTPIASFPCALQFVCSNMLAILRAVTFNAIIIRLKGRVIPNSWMMKLRSDQSTTDCESWRPTQGIVVSAMSLPCIFGVCSVLCV